ncbi:MAG: hypothetical protein FWC71_04245 [Defluviitaleaceae bacterium]|nr:hypothetical protein [Defluviitaleaceae bacterium]
MIKLVYLFLASALLLIVVTGCSNSPQNERDIMRDIEAHPVFFADEITGIEILRRQTMANENQDTVWVTVQARQGNVEYRLSYTVYYVLYNDGWRIRNLNRYRGMDAQWSKTVPSRDQVLHAALNALEYDGFILNRNLNIESVVLPETFSDEIFQYAEHAIFTTHVEVEALNDDVLFSINYSVSFRVGVDGWEFHNANIVDRHAVPLSYMPLDDVNHYVFSLIPHTGFSSTINFISRDIDLNRDFDSDRLVYQHRTTYHFLTEYNYISVFPFFDSWDGQWRIRRSDIYTYYTSQYWHINGRWEYERRLPPSMFGGPPRYMRLILDIEHFDGVAIEGSYYFRYNTRLNEGVGRIYVNRGFVETAHFRDRIEREFYYAFWGRAWTNYPSLTIGRNSGVQIRMNANWSNPTFNHFNRTTVEYNTPEDVLRNYLNAREEIDLITLNRHRMLSYDVAFNAWIRHEGFREEFIGDFLYTHYNVRTIANMLQMHRREYEAFQESVSERTFYTITYSRDFSLTSLYNRLRQNIPYYFLDYAGWNYVSRAILFYVDSTVFNPFGVFTVENNIVYLVELNGKWMIADSTFCMSHSTVGTFSRIIFDMPFN